jgi:hypothetical protein
MVVSMCAFNVITEIRVTGGDGLRLLNGQEVAGRIECKIGQSAWGPVIRGELLWACIGGVGTAEGKAVLVEFGLYEAHAILLLSSRTLRRYQ